MFFPADRLNATRSLWPSECGAVAAVKAAVLEWRTRRRGRNELASMTGRDRHDLGYSNCDVDAEAGKPFWIP